MAIVGSSPKSERYPKADFSVTEVIYAYRPDDSLVDWAHRLGREGRSWRKERGAAAAIGTKTHKWIEGFLDGKVGGEPPSVMAASWLLWYDSGRAGHCHGDRAEVRKEVETPFGTLGGTTDLVQSSRVVDWKGSKNPAGSASKHPWPHILQVTAYADMHGKDAATIVYLGRNDVSYAELNVTKDQMAMARSHFAALCLLRSTWPRSEYQFEVTESDKMEDILRW